ncbi:hypothetical protein Bbelb_434660 [Branchiostoma belcheri]|nr:hypothetical protein Bbelb_434660 [Branchiostoma belcheri]
MSPPPEATIADVTYEKLETFQTIPDFTLGNNLDGSSLTQTLNRPLPNHQRGEEEGPGHLQTKQFIYTEGTVRVHALAWRTGIRGSPGDELVRPALLVPQIFGDQG